MTTAQKYPIGIQDFVSLRESGYVYVDKTKDICNLVSEGKHYFLSRPRRFGKSLLLSTLKAYFEGRRELFRGLYIDSANVDWTPRPVFHFNFVSIDTQSVEGLNKVIENHLSKWESIYGVEVLNMDFGQRFYNLIRKSYELTGQRVAVLIDEYDKMLVNNLHNPCLHDDIKAVLRPIYSSLKGADEYIQFSLITGVSRFSKLTIFSDLNNLKDISLSDSFCTICGITESEVIKYFTPSIVSFAEKLDIDFAEMMERLKKNYDGYHFSENCPDLYNPFSLLNAFDQRKLVHFWYSTGTPTFLVKRIMETNEDIREVLAPVAVGIALANTETMNTSLTNMLFQTGYLTIKDYCAEDDVYTLGIPNMEVETGLYQSLLPLYSGKDIESNSMIIIRLRDAVRDGQPEEFIRRLKSLFADIPYDLSENRHEIYFENNLYLIFKMLGFYVATEYHTSRGRIDVLLKSAKYIYVIELKLDGTAEEALAQIKEREYTHPFLSDGREVIRIGLGFSKATRNINSELIER